MTEAEDFLRSLDQAELRTSPSLFAQNLSATYTEPWEPYPHLEYINKKITDLIENRTPKKRLLITTPPRHGKSLLCSVYTPAWFLNKYPTKRVILASYGDDFAAEWGRQVRDLIDQNESKLNITVSRDSSAANRWKIDGHTGGMVTAGVGGQLTGRGAHLFIIDDPIKDAEEANSAVIRDQKWRWWTTVAQTRLEPGGVVVLILTRWHEDDLAGRILQHEPQLWEHVNLPAIAEEGDLLGRTPGAALCPERYDENALGAIRTSIGSSAFSSLYQQRPTPEGGGVFKERDFRTWTPSLTQEKTYILRDDDGSILVPSEECWRFATCDLAITKNTTSDYTVIGIWDVAPWLTPTRMMLVQIIRERIDGSEHVPLIKSVWNVYRPHYIGIESASFGSMTIQAVRREGIIVRELKARSRANDKEFRAKDAALLMEQHRVYFPSKADWLAAYRHELLAFPAGTHDDMVDVTAYACREILTGINLRGPRPETTTPLDTMSAIAWETLRHPKTGYDHPVIGRVT